MALHHASVKKAQKMGVILTEDEDNTQPNKRRFMAHWPKLNVRLFGADAKYLMTDMAAIIEMEGNYQSFDWDIMEDDTCSIQVKGTDIEVKGLRPADAFSHAKQAWLDLRSKLDIEDEEQDNENEEKVDEEIAAEEEKSGSVVSPRYRAKYAEAGHPTHCGDWLASTLVNLCTNKAGIDIALFDAIAAANGVDLSKYNRTSHGWQGRLRMTGRNLMARRVYDRGGNLLIPVDMANPTGQCDTMQAPAEWMQAQRFKTSKKELPINEVSHSTDPEEEEKYQNHILKEEANAFEQQGGSPVPEAGDQTDVAA